MLFFSHRTSDIRPRTLFSHRTSDIRHRKLFSHRKSNIRHPSYYYSILAPAISPASVSTIIFSDKAVETESPT